MSGTDSLQNEQASPLGWRIARGIAIISLVVAGSLLLSSTIVFVDETEFVIVEVLGEIDAIYDQSAGRGLHFKFPWPIGSVRRFDSRTQLYDPPGREMFTSGEKNITVDTYVCWKIADPPLRAPADGIMIAGETIEAGQIIPRRLFEQATRDQQRLIETSSLAEPVRFAPSEGITIAGKKFAGGDIVLDRDFAQATAAQKKLLRKCSLLTRPVFRFFTTLGDIDGAEARLNTQVSDIVATRIGKVDLSELLNVEDSEGGPADDSIGLLEQISNSVRDDVADWLKQLESKQNSLGIEIVDVRIKRINFPLGNQQSVFERMKSERRKIADKYRTEGTSANTVIKSQANLRYAEILAKANSEAERIRGEAEAKAISIRNQAHARDPEFSKHMQTLDAYRKILNERTTLVLSASSNLLKLLTEGIPELGEPPASDPQTPTKAAATGNGEKVSTTPDDATPDDATPESGKPDSPPEVAP